MKKIELKIEKKTTLINAILKADLGLSYAKIQSLLRNKDVRLDGVKMTRDVEVTPGGLVTIFVAENQLFKPKFYEVFYQDENILIANKNQGIEVSAKDNPTSLQRLLEEELGQKFYPVHRIDRNTKGLVIFAKSYRVLEVLKEAMKNGEVTKIYTAEIIGKFEENQLVAEGFLVKDSEKSRVKIYQKPVKNSSKIITKITTISASGGTSVVGVEITHGKTHQIRAHLSYLGHPIIGDQKYGNSEQNKKYKAKYQRLTASGLVFNLKNNQLKYLNDKNFQLKN